MSSAKVVVVDDKYCFEEETELTVHKTSIFFQGDGFIAYDPNGDVLFRFDSYGPDSQAREELVLTDADGKCLLTFVRKKPSLHQRWEGFKGERKEDQEPIFTVGLSSIIGRSDVAVHVYTDPPVEYRILGSFPLRCCRICTTSSEDYVAEIKRKVDLSTDVMLGRDVFLLRVKPAFDSAFAMGLVLVLDQIYGGDEVEGDDEEIVSPQRR